MVAICERSLPALILTHKPFMVFFSLLCLVEEGSAGEALTVTWHPSRVKPPQTDTVIKSISCSRHHCTVRKDQAPKTKVKEYQRGYIISNAESMVKSWLHFKTYNTALSFSYSSLFFLQLLILKMGENFLYMNLQT